MRGRISANAPKPITRRRCRLIEHLDIGVEMSAIHQHKPLWLIRALIGFDRKVRDRKVIVHRDDHHERPCRNRPNIGPWLITEPVLDRA